MHRCLELAKLGAGAVAPNPMVGAVLVHKDRIIGEGYHQRYGEAHAEVNCINSVKQQDQPLIKESTLYVSLEPCAHHGKTPPCADLIIKNKIPEVVIGCRDPFTEVDGKGIEKLKAAGIKVISAVLENECKELNKRFLTFHTKKQPYIILKWAQSFNKKIAANGNERTLISNDYSNRLVHKWRSEEAGILVGTTTALRDNPELTNRLWQGAQPIRMVIDTELRIPVSYKLYDRSVRTIIFNTHKQQEEDNLLFYKLERDHSFVEQILQALYGLNIQSVLIEGGAKLLQSFIDESAWDEARIITNTHLLIQEGLNAPLLANAVLKEKEIFFNDSIHYYLNRSLTTNSLLPAE